MAGLILVYSDLHRIEKLAVVAGQARHIVLLAGVENIFHQALFLLGKALLYFEPVWTGHKFKTLHV